MARPIAETPILYGENARRFEALMLANKKNPAERERILKVYEIFKDMMKRGEESQQREEEMCRAK